ncbi:hypothetical protein C5C74_09570 [Rathayibacter sp. AY1E8]|uniref:hypothetical protein n=1 Tax=unclassified Rathayibacter TaxID=2609250 RepID=UPI000CE7353C|nr:MULTISPECIES: hypothetical protein [unclassified Rathayibacter]PPG17979.1 hypothetical protein C5C74_09570 [Rathayibacter sp. AY1E8]PPI01179.1 hypothetical protein C5C95_03315 [Rathayibacter sp. AY1B7]
MSNTSTGQATPEQLALICTTQRASSADYDTASDAEILEAARNTLCLPGTAAPGALAVEQDGSPFAEALIALLMPAVDAAGAVPDAPALSVEEALAVFVDTFASGDLAGDVATRLNCGEVGALAGLLRAAGRKEAADLWIAEHATDDDEGDAHHAQDGIQR